MGKYILNLETNKVELHFSKEEYKALPENMKSEIKSTCLWSGKQGAWVSRSTNNHYSVKRVAEKLNLEDGGKIGQRLSYAEQLEAKADRAEARAERYEQYSNNADKRAETLQADFNKYRKDWSWLTQPIIAGHSGSRAFANHRNKVIARYERGMEEYRKSEYYQDRAKTARETASNAKLQDKVYLDKKIKESNKQVKVYQDCIVKYEEALYKIQQGEELKNRKGEALTAEYIEERITDLLEKYEWENDKLEFFENCLNELGGVQFSRDNIKVGYIVDIKRWGKCEVVSTGPVNITYKILTGGAVGGCLTDTYAIINSIITAKEETTKVENPFEIGDILCKYYGMDSNNGVYKAFQVINITKTGVKIQQIAVENKKPIKNSFLNEKPTQKKVVKSKFSDFVGIYDDNWQLHKYDTKQQNKEA